MSKVPSKISAHVLDTARGLPAANLSVRLDVLEPDGQFRSVSEQRTSDDGRVAELLAGQPLEARVYRVVFETEAYLVATRQPVFYPRVEVVFRAQEGEQHYHIPLLLSPYGYTTYRGS
jgi:5-hydroxyisourate hydrolase